MAKKPLTPEQAEIKAMKKVKSSENWIKFWAILLAAVLTVAVVFMGKTAAEDAIAKATGAQTEEGGDVNTPSGDTNTPSGDTNTPSGDTNTPSGDTNTPSGDANTPSTPDAPSADAGVTAADVAKAINDATAKAAKASYTWTRDAKFTKDVAINPSFLTGAVNSIITLVDPNANLNSVVGGFLGIPGNGVPKTANVANGKLPEEGMDAKYLLVATTLKDSHIEKFEVNGNTYKVYLKNSTTPNGNKATALENASTDYITVAEVNKNIADFTSAISIKESSVSEYTNIVVTAVIENGNLTSYQVDYDLAANLDLSIGAKGAGSAKISAKYTNIKY